MMRQFTMFQAVICATIFALCLASLPASAQTMVYQLDELRSTWATAYQGQGSGGLLQGSLMATVVEDQVTLQNIDVSQSPSGDPYPMDIIFPGYTGTINNGDLIGIENTCPPNPANSFTGTLTSQSIRLTGTYTDCCAAPPCRIYSYNLVGSTAQSPEAVPISLGMSFLFAVILAAVAVLFLRKCRA